MAEKKRKLKIVYMKIEDPIAWKKPEAVFDTEDTDLFEITVVNVAGIVLHETEDSLTIGEIQLAKDNPNLANFGVIYPRFRYVMTVSKKNILERKDFEVEA